MPVRVTPRAALASLAGATAAGWAGAFAHSAQNGDAQAQFAKLERRSGLAGSRLPSDERSAVLAEVGRIVSALD